ncbi:MAG TPA: hypothetical protein VNS33_00770 [Bradyrhizobium sp.]|nr:hypothetical protein [Bradyrhizobium sp.]
MLAEADVYPKELPPGYEFVIEDEPEFDPAIHLQLERPEQIWTLADLGYDEDFIARFASPIALTTPARLLSKEGVAAMQHIAHQLQPYVRHNPTAKRVAAVLRGTTHRSKFMRDLCLSTDLTAFFSEMFQTPLMPHTVTHHQGHMNFAPREVGRQVDTWHHDATAFDWVLMVHDPKTVKGGRFQVFNGTRQEGWDLYKEHGDLPEDRVLTPAFPDAGYACYQQGCAVFHRATKLEETGFRASVVQSYVSRDIRFPDPNRAYFIANRNGPEAALDPNYLLERNCSAVEWARHRAWISKAKLARVLEKMPFSETPDRVIQWLEEAVSDVNALVSQLKLGEVPSDVAQKMRDDLDERQVNQPLWP